MCANTFAMNLAFYPNLSFCMYQVEIKILFSGFYIVIYDVELGRYESF